MASSPHHETTEYLLKGNKGNEMQLQSKSLNRK